MSSKIFSPYIVMATNKSKKKHSNKRHSKKRHDTIKKKHRRHRTRKSNWQNNYIYESDNVYLPSVSNATNKHNNGNIINGLRDYLSLKKDTKKRDHYTSFKSLI